LFIDALNFTISLSLKPKEENVPSASFESLMEDKLGLVDELALLAFNIRKEVCGILNSFLSFLKTYEKEKHATWCF
jgi:hypothetical protein